MRDEITQYLGKQKLGTFAMARELPWSADGTALYLKNFKKIYVDRDLITQTDDLQTLGGPVAIRETTSVSVYFTTDAKNLPQDYATTLSTIRSARLIPTISGVIERQADVTTSYEGDAMVTRVEFRFSKLYLN